jgi:hypothetical protein
MVWRGERMDMEMINETNVIVEFNDLCRMIVK